MTTVAFYSGALMSPEAIRSAYPLARFIARASIAATGEDIPERFASVIGDRIWGIAVEVGVELAGEAITATADDGRSLRVILAESPLSGDPAMVLANARYWELPPAFVRALHSVIQPGQDEE